MPQILKKTQTIVTSALAPRWESTGGEVKLYHGHTLDVLKRLPTRSVHCVVTSPPYWGLRDYGTGTWVGGSADCDHMQPSGVPRAERQSGPYNVGKGGSTHEAQEKRQYSNVCGKCGATRIDQQIGAEDTPEQFVANMVELGRCVRHVLRDDGTFWLNLGDSFGDGGQLQGIPWRSALALQADGWILRQDIIWYAPNKMPESVTNRCAKSHEHIFLLAKSNDYYFDHDAIKVDSARPGDVQTFGKRSKVAGEIPPDSPEYRNGKEQWGTTIECEATANKRDVWIVPTQGYPGAHFATFSPKLITPCILAGTSEYGCCAKCGDPYKRVVAKSGGALAEPDADGRDRSIASNRNGITGSLDGEVAARRTAGWKAQCICDAGVVPCTVLDPFVGSGTTPATAVMHGRRGIGVDLSEKYILENAVPRCEEAVAIARHEFRPKANKVLKDKPLPVKKVF